MFYAAGSMVWAIVIQLSFIVLERVAYLRRSMTMRLGLQYTATAVLHYAIVFVLPPSNKQYLPQSSSLIAFYLLQCLYLGLGAAQIRDGFVVFPLEISGYTTYGFGILPNLCFMVSRLQVQSVSRL
jgi:hypothetical protein